MATFESVFDKNLYTTAYDYNKVQGVNGVKPRTYDGTVVLAAGITQKNGNTFPLVHAKDIQLGQVASERLTDKLAAYDAILREIYGRAPSALTNLTNSATGHGTQSTAGENMDSLSDLAYILNDRTETVDERIKDLRMFKTVTISAQGSSTNDTTEGTAATNLVADSNNDTLTIGSENQWIILKAITDANGTDSFTIGHYKKVFSPTTGTTDLNSNGTFAIPVLGYDAAGHITSKKTTTYTLPYNYKTIKVGAQSAETTDLTTVTGDLIAANQVDNITFITANKWIHLAADTTNNIKSVKIAHLVQTINTSTDTIDLNSSGTFMIQYFTYDEAGHVRSKKETTYTAPYNYKTISVGAQSSAVTDLTVVTGDLTCGNQVDSITFITANKWVHLAASTVDNTKSIQIAHLVQTISTSTDAVDFDNNATFTVPYITYDEAGHITAKKTTTYTIQDGYKTFKLSNAASTAVSELTVNSTDVIAESRVDTLTLAAGNMWLRFAGDNTTSGKKITIAHTLSALSSGAHTSNWTQTAQTPNFGSSFNILIPKVSFTTDAAGHVTAYSYDNTTTTTVTIPKGSISTKSNSTGNVMTALSLTDTSMAFVREFAYIADLTLTNYGSHGVTAISRPSGSTATETINATDTLKAALAKLQFYAISNHNAIDAHAGITSGNPHNVTASDVGLGNVANKNLNNVDNAQQIKALSSINTTDVNVNKVAVWTAKNTLAVGHKVECDVPENAVFTDHTYSTGDASTSGLTKLYATLSGNTNKTDGTLTMSALNAALTSTKDDAINTILDNFEGITLKMPTGVEWTVIDDHLSYNLGDYEFTSTSTIKVYKIDGTDQTEFNITNTTVESGNKFKLNVIRTLTIGSKTYTESWFSDVYTV